MFSRSRLAALAVGLGAVCAVNSAHATLVAYYPLNIAYGASDASGNGNNGTVIGGVSFTADSAVFNGSDYISASAAPLPTGARTVDLFFNAATVADEPVMLGYGGGSCGTSFFEGLGLSHTNDYFVASHCGVNTITSSYGNTPPVNAWHNLAVTTDPTGTAIYLDGVEIASNNNFINNTQVAGARLDIGVDVSPGGGDGYTDGNVGFFIGQLADVRIYDTALSANQIAGLAADGPTSVPEPASSTMLLAGLGFLGMGGRRLAHALHR